MRIITIRHGQTVWNLDRRIQGQTDIALDDVGLMQGQKAAKRLEHIPCDIIYTSDLLRASKTAELINAYHNAPLVMDKALREMNLGFYEGRSWEDIDMSKLHALPHDNQPESFADMYDRVKVCLDKIIDAGHQNIFIVSHNGTIKAMICYFLSPSAPSPPDVSVKNTALHVFEKRDSGWVMTVENDIRHLE